MVKCCFQCGGGVMRAGLGVRWGTGSAACRSQPTEACRSQPTEACRSQPTEACRRGRRLHPAGCGWKRGYGAPAGDGAAQRGAGCGAAPSSGGRLGGGGGARPSPEGRRGRHSSGGGRSCSPDSMSGRCVTALLCIWRSGMGPTLSALKEQSTPETHIHSSPSVPMCYLACSGQVFLDACESHSPCMRNKRSRGAHGLRRCKSSRAGCSLAPDLEHKCCNCSKLSHKPI